MLTSNQWTPFRDGISMIRLYGDGDSICSAALLRYAPGARLPTHVHNGFEHIMVLSGTQSDERGDYPAGALVVNAPGTQHSVYSQHGCDVLVIWGASVTFIGDAV
ncbi:MAG TPA: cupin domain-containing protein [Polyangiaceae bacterium]